MGLVGVLLGVLCVPYCVSARVLCVGQVGGLPELGVLVWMHGCLEPLYIVRFSVYLESELARFGVYLRSQCWCIWKAAALPVVVRVIVSRGLPSGHLEGVCMVSVLVGLGSMLQCLLDS